MLLDDGQLQLGHLLHLSVHVDLVQQRAALAAQETQRVLLPLTLGQQRGARRVDRRHPVLQVGLVGGLDGTKGDRKLIHVCSELQQLKKMPSFMLSYCYTFFICMFLLKGRKKFM